MLNGRVLVEAWSHKPAPSGGGEEGGNQTPSFECGGSSELGPTARKLLNSVQFFKDLDSVLDRCLDVLMRCKSQPLASETI